ncbi:MAG: HAMP domain-containing histidine kinase [Sporocytophaga sp.]|nr:HAMP domain-containing histidine kinase [Sporocytophaga sp.]
MKNLLRKNIFLFLSLLFFLLSFVTWNFFNNSSETINKKKIVNAISGQIELFLQKNEKSSELLFNTLENKSRYSFSSLNIPSDYPYYIFKNKQLIYWSDFRFVPLYDHVKGEYSEKILFQKTGKYLVSQKKLVTEKDVFEVYFLTPVRAYINQPATFNDMVAFKPIINDNNVRVLANPANDPDLNIHSPQNEFLFSIEFFEINKIKSSSLLFTYIILSFLALAFLVTAIYRVALKISEKNFDLATVILVLNLLVIRIAMLFLNYPSFLSDMGLFNPKYFASSVLSPSLGDLLLNFIFLFLTGLFVFMNFHRSRLLQKANNLSRIFRKAFSVILIILALLIQHQFFFILRAISLNSTWSIDITTDISFGFFRISSIVALVFASINLFLLLHLIVRVLQFFCDNQILKIIWASIIAWSIFSVFSYFILGGISISVSLACLVYILVISFLKLPRQFIRFRYGTYIYLIFSGLLSAFTAAVSIYVTQEEKEVIRKQKFASQLVIDNDVLGEYLLSDASKKIKEDIFIKSRLVTPFSSKDIIEQKIKKIYLSNYFDKYDVAVSVFDASGDVFEKKSYYANYFELLSELKKGQHRTEYKNIYFQKENLKDGFRRYICFNEIEKNNVIIGYIIIELKHRKIIPNSVYPELFLDKKVFENFDNKNYHYAVFSDSALLYSSGNFNYDKNLSVIDLSNKRIYNEGVKLKGFHHLAFRPGNGKIIVVSSPEYAYADIFSNFSFLFLILIVSILLFIVGYAVLFRFKKDTMSLSAKIQIYLNIAFFLPLFIVSVITLSIISNTYRENLYKAFIKKAESISGNISVYVEGYKKDNTKREKLENTVLQVSQFTESDINIFNNGGKLLISSQPAIYNAGIVSEMMNPKAYSGIIETRKNVVMLTESVGKLNYKNVYVAIRSFETGNLLGILSIPFFESKAELEKQVIEVLTTIINIFVTIFIVFIALSYFVSHLLTNPLKIITHRIRRTSFGEENEPLEWKSKDEIGLLVGEYNEMLVKLEESKRALSRSEKESAWREMAKQVAHEIKNPLTPMKLTIQHLQRMLKDEADNGKAVTQRSLNTLLDQINNLNEIATSFSSFAKMPNPKSERIEVSGIAESVVNLYNNSKDAVVEIFKEAGKYYVIGDEQAMNSIFTNLILNGIQSVPYERKPHIQVIFREEDSKNLLIEIRDNGSGIPESVRSKVFIPNFSTKFSGSGIGLAVAKKGVEHAGGKIWFTTEDGIGTSFFIELPLIH